MKFSIVAIVALLACLCVAPTMIESQSQPVVFERLLIIMFENNGYYFTSTNPLWQPLIQSGLLFTNFHAITHPSQPNYVAMTGGDTLGCVDDSPFSTDANSIVDLLEGAGYTWKAYQEDYVPGPNGACNTASNINKKYYRKHNPFMSFSNIRENATRCAEHIFPATQLDADIASGNLPNYMYYTPNIDNDAHNTNLTYAGEYLTNWFQKYMTNPVFTQNTLVLVTFDEDEYLENEHIVTFVAGPGIVSNTTNNGTFNHYSITATLEANYKLGNLGRNDVNATSFLDVLKQQKEEAEQITSMF